MVVLAFTNNSATDTLLQAANEKSNQANSRFQRSLRNSEVVAALGMSEDVAKSQNKLNDEVVEKQTASRKAAALNGLSKSFRLISQSLLLGLGAYLALNQEISPGMMIAGSLLLGRALAPIDMLVGTWKGFSLATAQYNRLKDLLERIPSVRLEKMSLPAPSGSLAVEQMTVIPPGSETQWCVECRSSYWLAKCLALLGQALRANLRSQERCWVFGQPMRGRSDSMELIFSHGIESSWGPILDTCLKISSYLTEPSLKILQGSERRTQTMSSLQLN